jgi:hypothetical protein
VPRKNSRKKDNIPILKIIGVVGIASIVVIAMVAWVLPLFLALDNPLQSLIPVDDALTEEEVQDNPFVTVKVYCRKDLARTSSDQNIDIYNHEKVWLETVTTSSGVATCSNMYHTEQTLWLQPRQAAPGTADPYVGPMEEFTVPTGDAGDTVSLGTVYVRDVTGTAATLSVRDPTNAISDATTNYLNTTDTSLTVTLSAIDSNTYYGMESFTDYTTMNEYLGGLWFCWKGTVGQSFAADYSFADGTNVYYLFFIADFLVDDANVATDDVIVASIATQGGAALVADSSVVLDVYDGLWLINNDVNSIASFVDTQSVTAITTKVA